VRQCTPTARAGDHRLSEDPTLRAERVVATFELGRPVRPAESVPGGLSNDLWRLETERGAFAVKRLAALP
jgi:hypothetical protein